MPAPDGYQMAGPCEERRHSRHDRRAEHCRCYWQETSRIDRSRQSDWTPPHLHINHGNKSLQRKPVTVQARTGIDPLDVHERHGYSRSATEHRPAGDRCGRAQRNVNIVESRRNGPLLSMRYDDDDDVACRAAFAVLYGA